MILFNHVCVHAVSFREVEEARAWPDALQVLLDKLNFVPLSAVSSANTWFALQYLEN